MFGKSGEGVHAYRIANIAVMDVMVTVIVAVVLSKIFMISFWKMLVGLLILGIVVHRQLCVRTTIDKWLFP
jgi:F0F1-type ATP synthase assembly protein I